MPKGILKVINNSSQIWLASICFHHWNYWTYIIFWWTRKLFDTTLKLLFG